MNEATGPVLAVFASDKGPGDPERSSIMSQAGTYFAKKGARIIALAEHNVIPVPLVTSARSAGGEVTLICDTETAIPSALADVPAEMIENSVERTVRLVAAAHVIIGLPGSLASATRLHATWAAARSSGVPKPVVLLNRHRAFEVMRGFAADVITHDVPHLDRHIQFSDSIEDVWSRVARMIS